MDRGGAARAKGGKKGGKGGEEEEERGAERGRLRVLPPPQTPTPEPYLQSEVKGQGEAGRILPLSFWDIHPLGFPPPPGGAPFQSPSPAPCLLPFLNVRVLQGAGHLTLFTLSQGGPV